MRITKTSMATGRTRTLDIPVTEQEVANWEKGMLIQEAMPNLSPDHREFLMTGITKEEWDELFLEPDGEPNDPSEEPF
jgi:hypothetical protein